MTNQVSSMRRILTVFIALAVGLLAGCGIFSGKEVDETRGWTAQKLYAEARQELSDRNWENAIKHYERIESRYPFGRFAQQAQIEVAYAHWKNDDIAYAGCTFSARQWFHYCGRHCCGAATPTGPGAHGHIG